MGLAASHGLPSSSYFGLFMQFYVDTVRPKSGLESANGDVLLPTNRTSYGNGTYSIRLLISKSAFGLIFIILRPLWRPSRLVWIVERRPNWARSGLRCLAFLSTTESAIGVKLAGFSHWHVYSPLGISGRKSASKTGLLRLVSFWPVSCKWHLNRHLIHDLQIKSRDARVVSFAVRAAIRIK